MQNAENSSGELVAPTLFPSMPTFKHFFLSGCTVHKDYSVYKIIQRIPYTVAVIRGERLENMDINEMFCSCVGQWEKE